jgi:hypothetical protein
VPKHRWCSGPPLYSVTARLTINANGVVGSTHTNLNIAFVQPSAVPVPNVGAGLPGMILASGAGGILAPAASMASLKSPYRTRRRPAALPPT